MKKLSILFSLLLLISCQNFGELDAVTSLPRLLDEVSGIQESSNSDIIWMVNDSGNEPLLFGVTSEGEIHKTLQLNVKNHDWEALTSDNEGNLYVADFGNNNNKRKNLVILKVKQEELYKSNEVKVERIEFSYPNQTKFPPKKNDRFFDAESLLYRNGFLYIFTKSRVKENYGKTMLYKIPAFEGNYAAQYISEFNNCNEFNCSITDAAISPDGKKVALLTHQSLIIFTNFKGDNFFNGDMKTYTFNHISQKEGITFIDNTTVYITDEASKGYNATLYKFYLKE